MRDRHMPLVDVTQRAEDADVREVLSLLAWTGRAAHLERIVANYTAGPSRLLACVEDGCVTGVIGIETEAAGRVVIRHIAVMPPARGRGVGRMLIDGAAAALGTGASLIAETDQDALGFYRACGFSVLSQGEMYPGVERFLCERSSN